MNGPEEDERANIALKTKILLKIFGKRLSQLNGSCQFWLRENTFAVVCMIVYSLGWRCSWRGYFDQFSFAFPLIHSNALVPSTTSVYHPLLRTKQWLTKHQDHRNQFICYSRKYQSSSHQAESQIYFLFNSFTFSTQYAPTIPSVLHPTAPVTSQMR